ncbi:hypothetical protein DIZ76_010446 [Coccidioides immitis]|nr:hypothetical protein DIZ76_010446 [Coccidioides immitis]
MSTMSQTASRVFTVKVQRPHETEAEDHGQNLPSQLETIPKDASTLRIEDNTPSDEEWALLGEYFTSVTDLDMDTGLTKN